MSHASDVLVNESAIQRAIVQYLRLRSILHYKITNEGKRSAQYGANLVAEGLSKGVPDLCIAEPRGPYHGLYLEVKGSKGRLTLPQTVWLKKLNEKGYLACEAKGLEQALKIIDHYLALGSYYATPKTQ